MFSINIVFENNTYHFTLVRPDTTYVSGVRSTLAEVWELSGKEISKWNRERQAN